MYLTVVVDNMCGNNRLWGEHGLSIYIETPRGNVMMDTGQGHSLFHNMTELDISRESIDHLVLSHGHYDHCWGANQLLVRRPDLPLWASENINAGHGRRRTGKKPIDIGHSLDMKWKNCHLISGPTEIVPNLWAFTVPPESRDPEFVPDTPGLVSPAGDGKWEIDQFPDDMSLLVKGSFGTSIIMGCAHSGAVNIMRYAAKEFGESSFYSVTGGMHLVSSSTEKCNRVAEALKEEFTVEKWRPCHCTGFKAAAILSNQFKDLQWASSGTRMEI